MSAVRIIISLVVIIILGIIGIKIRGYFWPEPSTKVVEEDRAFKERRSFPAEAEPVPDKEEERWNYTHTEFLPGKIRHYWFKPFTEDKVETDWFIVKNSNYGYRVLTDTIIEFKSETSGKITVVKINGNTGEVFLKRNDSFSITPWIESEFVLTRNDAESVRFKSIDGTPLQVKAWRYQ